MAASWELCGAGTVPHKAGRYEFSSHIPFPCGVTVNSGQKIPENPAALKKPKKLMGNYWD